MGSWRRSHVYDKKPVMFDVELMDLEWDTKIIPAGPCWRGRMINLDDLCALID